MRELINSSIVVITRLEHFGGEAIRFHRLDDLFESCSRESRHLVLIVVPVEGHPQQRKAMAVLVGWIEVQIAAAIRHDGPLSGIKGAVTIMLLHGLLPAAAPSRGAGRYQHLRDGPAAGARCKDR